MNINLSKLFPKNYKIEDIYETHDSIHIKVISKSRTSSCPCCGKESNKVHSKYLRKFRDLPIINKNLYITFASKKFFCKNPECKRKIFTERYKEFIEAYARRSIRLNSAIKKGSIYGTLICDLETNRPIEVLESRSREELEAWLRKHKHVEIVTRDRASAYSAAVSNVLPKAIQITDRFHLVKNIIHMTKEIISSQYPNGITIKENEVCSTKEPIQTDIKEK